MNARMTPEERAEAFRQWTKGDPVHRSSWEVLLPALASAFRSAEQERDEEIRQLRVEAEWLREGQADLRERLRALEKRLAAVRQIVSDIDEGRSR